MTTSLYIDIKQTTAVIEWERDGATRSLATPDPDNLAIRFTLHIDQHRAHFEINIPFKFKGQPNGAAIYLRISPSVITSLRFPTEIDPSGAIKQRFGSATCLEFQLNDAITILVPSYVEEPISAFRRRSGKILDSIYELCRVNTLRIYIQDSLLSIEKQHLVSDRVAKCQLKLFSGPEYDISRMFRGSGAKITNPALTKPPSYEKAASLQPPSTPSSRRKRRRQDSPRGLDNNSPFWDKQQKQGSVVNDNIVEEQQAESAKPRDQKPELRESQAEILELRAENTQLREQVARWIKKQEELEAKVAMLQREQANETDADEAGLIEIRDDIDSLCLRVDYIEDGRDKDFIKKMKQEIFEELAARFSAD
ncbi:hypothetical protein IL306_002760 [Fusarium sp. DS 682]|nr:hypothetical protein IL306_002760 [Fusarium sp. DS 682]